MTQEQYNMYMNGLILKVASKKPLTKTASKLTILKRLKGLGGEAPKVLRDNIVEIFTKGKDKIVGGIKGGYGKAVDAGNWGLAKGKDALNWGLAKGKDAGNWGLAKGKDALNWGLAKGKDAGNWGLAKGKDALNFINAHKLGVGTTAGVAGTAGLGLGAGLSGAGNGLDAGIDAVKGFVSNNPYTTAGIGAVGVLTAGLLSAYLLRKDEKEKANA